MGEGSSYLKNVGKLIKNSKTSTKKEESKNHV